MPIPLALAMSAAMGGLQAGGSIASSFIDAATSKRNTDMTNAANMKLAEYQYLKDTEMWNKQNEYNSPASQMARYKAAGMNPQLVAGQGTSGNSVTIPRYQAPTQTYNYKSQLNPLEMLSAYQDAKLKQAQIDNVTQSVKNQKVDNALKALNLENLSVQSPYTNAYIANRPLVQLQQKQFYETRNKLMRDTLNSQILKFQQEAHAAILNNAMREIDLNWYKAEKWINTGAKAVGAVGLSKWLAKPDPATINRNFYNHKSYIYK